MAPRKFTAQMVSTGKKRGLPDRADPARAPLKGESAKKREGPVALRRRRRTRRSRSRKARPRRRPLLWSSSTRCRNTSKPSTSLSRVWDMPSLPGFASPEFGGCLLDEAKMSAARGWRAGSRNKRRWRGCDRCGSGLQGFPHIKIDGAGCCQGRVGDGLRQEGEQRLVLCEKFFGDVNVAVGEVLFVHQDGLFVARASPRYSQSSGQSTVTSRSVPQQRCRYRRALPDRSAAGAEPRKSRRPFY